MTTLARLSFWLRIDAHSPFDTVGVNKQSLRQSQDDSVLASDPVWQAALKQWGLFLKCKIRM
jgi:hypothetical protein